MDFPTFLLLLATMLSMSFVSFFKKLYKKSAPIFLSLCSSAFTLVFFIIVLLIQNGFNFTVDDTMIKYAIPYCVCYLISVVFSLLAVMHGDLSLTGLFISFALIIPTLYGIIMGDEVGTPFYIGLALFFVCLVLVNVKFNKKEKT
jgi:drug/metabolite transporter (DMT)-like permease